ncbi:hypothetical protein PAPHI01_0141 [Pancytospora philotis]|nr:hypothetical protein PAPHI01_0141 [Pancytospora philotis]
MEKFSAFRDPLTGINPFLPPKRRPITPGMCLRALVKLPLFLLYLCGAPVLHLLVAMRRRGAAPSGVVHVNSTGGFDACVLRRLFGIRALNQPRSGVCATFPEGASTNNQGVLAYEAPRGADYVIGLKYSSECIRIPELEGGFLGYIAYAVRLLGSSPTVDANCMPGRDLARAVGVPALSLTKAHKEKFLAVVRKRSD